LPSNYDNSAWFYDRLSRIILGKALIRAQTTFLPYLSLPNSKVLIAGGGTGWILEEIAKVHPSGLHITYVELSEKMMALCTKKKRRWQQPGNLYKCALFEEALCCNQ
jgi:ubiquinone/menaquinone biosynthesis C-methylase UbiE